MSDQNRYSAIIEKIFHSKFKCRMHELDFEREDIERFARQLKLTLPKNIGDLIYSFRFRSALPLSIQATAPKGKTWVIRLVGRG